MQYKEFYSWVQSHDTRVSTSDIRKKLISQGVVSRIDEFWHGFDADAIRAVFMRGPLQLGPFSLADNSECLFAVARDVGRDKKERRITICKELMHVFDGDGERTDSSGALDQLMGYLTQISTTTGRIEATEPRALVRALAAIVPEKMRQETLAQGENCSIYELSAKLGVPERHVQVLLRSDFLNLLQID